MTASDAWTAPYLLIASMNVDARHEAEFNAVYDEEHIPYLRAVPGVREIARYECETLSMLIGGERRVIEPSLPRYHALYALDGPDVTDSEAWGEAVERGRWPTRVRPFTRDRLHVLLRRLDLQGED